jgi:hypothetical protein
LRASARSSTGADAVGELLQALPHQLVVVAAQRVARHVGAFAISERLPRFLVVASAVVETDGNHAQGSGHEVVGARTFVAVARHPLHRSVQSLREPIAQMGFVLAQFHSGDATTLEAVFARQFANAGSQCDVVRLGVGERSAHRRQV